MEANVYTFPTIETERLMLREIESTDDQLIFNYFSDEDVVRYYGTEPFEKIGQARQLISQFHEGFKKRIAVRWGIALKDTNVLIGTCGFHNWSKVHYRAEIGYELDKNHWRKGYMSEVLAALLPYGFKDMDLIRIGATVRDENKPSIDLLEKFGFKQEGHMRNYQFVSGKAYDLVMYGLLAEEYRSVL